MAGNYTDYNQVPWHRRSGSVNLLVLVGFFGLAPLLWTACLICLTGDIYANELGEDGFLTKCPSSTRTAALIALLVQCLGIAYGVISYTGLFVLIRQA